MLLFLFFDNNKNMTTNNTNTQVFDYIGWVPCLTGKLFFEYSVCDAISPEGYLNLNNIDKDPDEPFGDPLRYLLIASSVDWFDHALDGCDEKDGQWKVVVLSVGKHNANYLEGSIFLIPSEKQCWSKDIQPKIKEIAGLIHEREHINTQYLNLLQRMEELFNQQELYSTKFYLNENGLVELGLSGSGALKYDSKTEELLCRQSYYYLKFAFHQHKHHDRSESLTTIHKKVGRKNQQGNLLINDMKKALVALKRNCSPSDYKALYSAQGVLAYCKSLITTCKKESLLTKESYEYEINYISNFSASLEIMANRVDNELVARAKFNSNFRSVIMLIFAILAPFILIFKEPISDHINIENNAILQLLKWIFESNNNVLIIVIGMVVAYFLLKKISLRYGSPALAFHTFDKYAVKFIDYAVNDPLSAQKLYFYVRAATIVLFIIFVYKLI